MKICYWTNYPSRYQAVFFQALREAGVDLRVVYFTTYGRYRLRLGWREDNALESWEVRASSLHAARGAIPDFNDRVQVCTGFFGWAYWRLVLYCIAKGLTWCACTEGSRGGWITLPLRVFFARLVDCFALGVFAIGSVACGQYARWGVRHAKIAWHSHSTPPTAALSRGIPVSGDNAGEARGCTFIFCGALTRRKAVDVLLKAFATVHARYPDSVLRLVGDGPMRTWCESFALDHFGVKPIQGHPAPLVFVGAVEPDAVDGELLKGDVVVLPSRYDAWGVALAEGGALGLAMIGSDRTGAAVDLIDDGENGYRVPAGDVEALVAAMLCYARQPELAFKHGVVARLSVARTYPEKRAQEFTRQLKDWMQQGGGGHIPRRERDLVSVTEKR